MAVHADMDERIEDVKAALVDPDLILDNQEPLTRTRGGPRVAQERYVRYDPVGNGALVVPVKIVPVGTILNDGSSTPKEGRVLHTAHPTVFCETTTTGVIWRR